MEGDLTMASCKDCLGFISIHPPRVEGDEVIIMSKQYIAISIHTLRVEGDQWQTFLLRNPCHFNPHPPCGG